MVYATLTNALETNNCVVKSRDFRALTAYERDNNVLFAIVEPLIRPYSFFTNNAKHLAFIQNGARADDDGSVILQIDEPFFGIIRDPEGYVKITGKTMEQYFCPSSDQKLAPVFLFIPGYDFDNLNLYVTDADTRKLDEIKRSNNVRLMIEAPLLRPMIFFENYGQYMMLVQDGLCHHSLTPVNKERKFFGIMCKPDGYKEILGEHASHYICPRDGKQLAPIWVYDPKFSL